MDIRLKLIALLMVLLGGCVAYSAIEPGPISVGQLQIDPTIPWNQAPTALSPAARPGTKTWTRDGLLLDRLIIIPGVPDGEPIFKQDNKAAALPAFQADMLANELEELTESSIVKLFGEGEVAVTTLNLRPNQFGENSGVMFDLTAKISDGPNYTGVVGAFIHESQLYMLIYIAAEPYYYEKHLEEAKVVIKSARISI